MRDQQACPREGCGKLLQRVVQSSPSYLSADQFDAARLGDWFCDNHKEEAPYVYFWDSVREATPTTD